MEKRYCDMDQLADEICSDSNLTEDEANKFIHLLWGQPRVDTIVIKRTSLTRYAHWRKQYYFTHDGVETGYECSSCGCEGDYYKDYKFCPNCGARMKNYNKPKE